MDIFYGWVGVGEGGLRYLLGELGWVMIFYGWVGADGGAWRHIWVSESGQSF